MVNIIIINYNIYLFLKKKLLEYQEIIYLKNIQIDFINFFSYLF